MIFRLLRSRLLETLIAQYSLFGALSDTITVLKEGVVSNFANLREKGGKRRNAAQLVEH
jgi:hypothetical protein